MRFPTGRAARVQELLTAKCSALEALAKRLMEKEVVSREALGSLLSGTHPR